MPRAMIRGDIQELLDRGPGTMRDVTSWTQRDSDIVAHFVQVSKQIQTSTWFTSPISHTSQGNVLIAAEMPALEPFVYAAVYFRQFTLQKDGLLDDAVERHSKHSGCWMRQLWIAEEAKAFKQMLNSPTFPTFCKDPPTLRLLFDAFVYGASLFHTVPHENSPIGPQFLEIYDNLPRAHVLSALHGGMRISMNHVTKIAALIYQDFACWQHTHSLPPPTVRWHDRLFSIPLGPRTATPPTDLA